MQGLSLKQNQQQNLSPQQIQYIKLLQIPTAELAARIEEELEDNPALEEGLDHNEEQEPRETLDDLEREEMEVGDYLQDDYAGYKMAGDSYDPNEETRERPLATESSTQEYLLNQIRYVVRTEREEILAQQIIGSLEEDGYLRRNIESIVNDLAFTQGFETDYDEVEQVLFKVQSLDPAGIAARSLQECLSLQLHRKVVARPQGLTQQTGVDQHGLFAHCAGCTPNRPLALFRSFGGNTQFIALAFMVHVINQIDASQEGNFIVDGNDFSVHAPQTPRVQFEEKTLWAKHPNLHTLFLQAWHPGAHTLLTTEAVKHQTHFNTPFGGCAHGIEESLARSVISKNVGFNAHFLPGLLDGLQSLGKQLRAPHQQFNCVAFTLRCSC